jgi:hypothetical protein
MRFVRYYTHATTGEVLAVHEQEHAFRRREPRATGAARCTTWAWSSISSRRA